MNLIIDSSGRNVYYFPGYSGEVYKTDNGSVYFYGGYSDEYTIEHIRTVLNKMEELELENSSNS